MENPFEIKDLIQKPSEELIQKRKDAKQAAANASLLPAEYVSKRFEIENKVSLFVKSIVDSGIIKEKDKADIQSRISAIIVDELSKSIA